MFQRINRTYFRLGEKIYQSSQLVCVCVCDYACTQESMCEYLYIDCVCEPLFQGTPFMVNFHSYDISK